MTPWLGVVADDYTGATDLAGRIASEGTSVTLWFGVPPPGEIASDLADCAVVALKSRSVEASAAVDLSIAAARSLRTGGIEHLYFKYCSTFDSTERGNIGQVAEALAKETGARIVPFVPSAPANGRTVYQGHLFVGRELLDESPLRNHPLNPMRDSDLARLLTPQVSWSVSNITHGAVARGAEQIATEIDALANSTHVIIDAISDEDLASIARATESLPLTTGSAGLAAALARTRRGRRAWSVLPAPRPALGGTVVISGSTSAATRGQVAAFRRSNPSFEVSPFALERGDPVVEAALEFVADALAAGAVPLVFSTVERDEILRAQNQVGIRPAAELVESALARIAVGARELGATRLIIAGGEVSGAVVNALNIARVSVHDEVAPGVPWIATGGPNPMTLLLKSGNFGAPEFFIEAVAR
ncbi:MAG: hypothetical protein JWQ12_2321 [Glaciihabitans sp.]|nr:hypothetical protein [Glaciihabitans sp.]